MNTPKSVLDLVTADYQSRLAAHQAQRDKLNEQRSALNDQEETLDEEQKELDGIAEWLKESS